MRTVAVRGGTTLVGVAITLAIAVTAGCRQPDAPAPLRTRPATTVPSETEWIVGHLKELEALTPAARAARAEQWLRAPGDLPQAEEVLLISSQNVAGETPEDSARRTALRRQVILWLIDQHPGHFVHRTTYTMLSSRTADPKRDLEGYRAAAERWERQASRADVTAAALGNAAHFFKASDPRRAETLLRRARSLEPDNADWPAALGSLYAEALFPVPPSVANPRPANADVVPVDSVLASRAREYLFTTLDAGVLNAMARAVFLQTPYSGERRVIALWLLKRALTIDFNNPDVAGTLDSIEFRDLSRQLNALFKGKRRESWADATSSLPPTERLRALVYLACSEYLMAENHDWSATRPRTEVEKRPENVAARRAEARRSFRRSRAWALQALALVDKNRRAGLYADADAFFHSHVVLGITALRDGDHAAARRHLLYAPVDRPSSTTLPAMGRALEQRLIGWLLKDGERETVAAYFERLATIDPDAQVRLRRAAKDVRDGHPPRDYFRSGSIYALPTL